MKSLIDYIKSSSKDCKENLCAAAVDYQHSENMRYSYRRYLSVYGLQLAVLFSAPYIYLNRGDNAKEYVGELFFSLIGMLFTYSIAFIIVLSTRLLARQTKLNTYFIRAQQIIRTKLHNNKKCSQCKSGFFVGLTPLRSSQAGHFYFFEEPEKGYYVGLYSITIAAGILLIASFPHYFKFSEWLITYLGFYHDFIYRIILSISLFLLLFSIWFRISLNTISIGVGHLTAAKAITEENPDPLFPKRHQFKFTEKIGRKDNNLFFSFWVWIILPFLFCLLILFLDFVANIILINNSYTIPAFILFMIAALCACIRDLSFIIKYHRVNGLKMVVDALFSQQSIDDRKDCLENAINKLKKKQAQFEIKKIKFSFWSIFNPAFYLRLFFYPLKIFCLRIFFSKKICRAMQTEISKFIAIYNIALENLQGDLLLDPDKNHKIIQAITT